MASMTKVKCAKCKAEFQARTADVNRGWGKFCSKSCKAKKQGRLPMSKETRAMWREHNRENLPPRVLWQDEETGEQIFLANFSNEEGSDI